MGDQFSIRKNRLKQQRRKRRIQMIAGVAVAVIIVGIGVFLAGKLFLSDNGGSGEKPNYKSEAQIKEEIRKNKIAEAKHLALTYDYDTAIQVLKEIDGADKSEEIKKLIADIEAEKATCVPVDMEKVTHIFYHSLIVDTERAFKNHDTDNQAIGNNQWMTTIDEFNKITQTMYDNGYVMVSLHDLVEETQDENGKTIYKPGTILLPPDKKPFVLSLDDLSYYHAYDGYGYATKLVFDENGDVMNEYTDAEGNTSIGAYDVVPLMDQFVKEHPDASYRGAKGIIALTGYNGVLGYRTDETYDFDHPRCDIHQQKWMKAHPDFTLENDIKQATDIANAMKENGWEFASHTWGHLRVGSRSLETLRTDNEKFKKNVVPIVGEVDTIIFAHGEDLSGVGAYPTNNEKFQYFFNEGYRFFCNVDSNKYTSFYGENYFRQGRRNLDGYRIYRAAKAGDDRVSDLFNASEVLDPSRPPVKPLQ